MWRYKEARKLVAEIIFTFLIEKHPSILTETGIPCHRVNQCEVSRRAVTAVAAFFSRTPYSAIYSLEWCFVENQFKNVLKVSAVSSKWYKFYDIEQHESSCNINIKCFNWINWKANDVINFQVWLLRKGILPMFFSFSV